MFADGNGAVFCRQMLPCKQLFYLCLELVVACVPNRLCSCRFVRCLSRSMARGIGLLQQQWGSGFGDTLGLGFGGAFEGSS